MRKYLITGFVLLAMLLLGSSVGAQQTATQIQARIAELQALITNSQAEISNLQTQLSNFNTSNNAANTQTQAPTLAVGDRVRVVLLDADVSSVNVRETASLSGTLVTKVSGGAQGVIIAGPTVSGGHTWWKVNFDYALDGWVAGEFLAKIVPAPTASIDRNSLAATAGQVTLSGYAYNVPALSATVTETFGISISDAGGKIWGSGNIPVVNNRWSVKTDISLNPGSYVVAAYSKNRMIAGGTLVVSSAPAQSSVTVSTPAISSITAIPGTSNLQYTIVGSNLSGVSSVKLYTTSGQLAASLTGTNVTQVNDRSVNFTVSGTGTSLSANSTYQVKVVTPNGTSNGFNFILLAVPTPTPAPAPTPVPASTVGPNLLINGNFSNGLNNWTAQGIAQKAVGVTNGILAIANDGSNSPNYYLRHQAVRIEPGATYEFGGTITANLGAKVGAYNTCQLDLYIPKYLDTNDIVLNQSGTQTFTKRVTIPTTVPTATVAYFRLLTGYALNGSCSYQNVFLRKVSGTVSEADELNQMASALQSLQALLDALR